MLYTFTVMAAPLSMPVCNRATFFVCLPAAPRWHAFTVHHFKCTLKVGLLILLQLPKRHLESRLPLVFLVWRQRPGQSLENIDQTLHRFENGEHD